MGRSIMNTSRTHKKEILERFPLIGTPSIATTFQALWMFCFVGFNTQTTNSLYLMSARSNGFAFWYWSTSKAFSAQSTSGSTYIFISLCYSGQLLVTWPILLSMQYALFWIHGREEAFFHEQKYFHCSLKKLQCGSVECHVTCQYHAHHIAG